MAMVELAMLGPTFLIALAVLFQFTYLFMAQMLVNVAVETVARSIQIGQAQSQPTQAAFNTSVLCPALLILPCANVLINVQAVTDWYTPTAFTLPTKNGQVNTAGFNFCNGGPGQLLQLNAVFMAPVLLGSFFPGSLPYNGGNSFPLYSSAAIGDENFPVTGAISNPC